MIYYRIETTVLCFWNVRALALIFVPRYFIIYYGNENRIERAIS
jgi:hypothetical protein